MLLRLEDHDRLRCRPEYESALLEDLEWLGLEPDLGAIAEFRAGESNLRQSDCEEIYQAAVGRMSDQVPVYACDCSRKDIAQDGGDAFNQETRYSGGVKLSKASGDTGIRELRRQGVAPGAILGQAAYLTGLLKTPRERRPADLAGLHSAG